MKLHVRSCATPHRPSERRHFIRIPAWIDVRFAYLESTMTMVGLAPGETACAAGKSAEEVTRDGSIPRLMTSDRTRSARFCASVCRADASTPPYAITYKRAVTSGFDCIKPTNRLSRSQPPGVGTSDAGWKFRSPSVNAWVRALPVLSQSAILPANVLELRYSVCPPIVMI